MVQPELVTSIGLNLWAQKGKKSAHTFIVAGQVYLVFLKYGQSAGTWQAIQGFAARSTPIRGGSL
jgi:hypothetical protein